MHTLTALEMARLVRDREISPVDLVEHHLRRIEDHGAKVGAFLHVAAEQALEQARVAEKRVMTEKHLPPLLGVPTAIKDLVGTSDMPTSYGVSGMKDFVPPVDAHLVRRLREAGTISLGKSNTAECGLTAYTDTVHGGSARTPWDLTRSAGGSSGGAAAAVAAGLVPFAHGNDGGGSIRVPASVCGLVGFKPSRGVVSDGPAGIDPTGQLHQGPLSRTVPDAAALLDAMAGREPDDLALAPTPRVGTYLDAAGRDPGRLRIGRYRDTGTPKSVAHPDVIEAYEAVSALLESLGHEVVDIEAPFGLAMEEEFYTVWAVRSLRLPASPEVEAGMRRMTRWWRERGRRTSAEEFLTALTALQVRGRQAVAAMQPYDAVLSPTLAMPPQTQEFLTSGTEEDELARQLELAPYVAVHNVTGLPAVNLPLHWNDAGQPIGVMLAGRMGEDALLFSLSSQLESARPWAWRRPHL